MALLKNRVKARRLHVQTPSPLKEWGGSGMSHAVPMCAGKVPCSFSDLLDMADSRGIDLLIRTYERNSLWRRS